MQQNPLVLFEILVPSNPCIASGKQLCVLVHVKSVMHAFPILHFTILYLTGPTKSTPVTRKGLFGSVLKSGNMDFDGFDRGFTLNRSHRLQLCSTFLTMDLNFCIQNLSQTLLMVTETPFVMSLGDKLV